MKVEDQFLNMRDLCTDKLIEIEANCTTNMLVDKRYKHLQGLIRVLCGKYGDRYHDALSLVLTQATLTVAKNTNMCKLTLDRNTYVLAKKQKHIKCSLNLTRSVLGMMQNDKLLTVYKGEYKSIPNFPFKTRGVEGGVTTVVEFHEQLTNNIKDCGLLRYVHCKKLPTRVVKCLVTGNILEETEDSFVQLWNDVLSGAVTIGDTVFNVRYQRLEHQDELGIYGGRFYCGKFQTLKSKYRDMLELLREKTIEFDFESCQPSLLCSLAGLRIPDNHKVYEAYNGLEGDPVKLRALFKSSFLAVLYSDSVNTAIGSVFKKLTNNDSIVHELGIKGATQIRRFASNIVNRLIEHNSFMKHLLLNKDGWKLLQTKESEICKCVVAHFIYQGIPILSYHDSFRVAEKYKDELKAVMESSWKIVTGNDFNCRVK